jgi:peptidoglycan/LPS O-acetylase OafA/YrhL
MILRLILFVLLAYLVWRIVESALRLTGRQKQTQGDIRGSSTDPKKAPAPPFRDIRDAEFEDLTPKKEGANDSPPPAS